MTISINRRQEAVRLALARMLEDLGDEMFIAKRFALQSERFSELPQTTWLELEGEMLVTPMHSMGSRGYRFAGRGWIAALKASGRYDSDQHQAREIALRKALKDTVKGRPLEGALTSLWQLVAATALPEGWIANALESRLIQYRWPSDHLDVDLRHGLPAVWVPARFGTERISGYTAGPFADP